LLILGLNTCDNGYLSVSISENDTIISTLEKNTKKTEETVNLIYEMFSDLSIKPEQISAIGLITGPGGYTGIRAGISVSKTMSQLLNIPIIGFSKSEAYIYSFNSNKLICPLIDVKRNEVYTCIGELKNNNILYNLSPCVMSFQEISEKINNSENEIIVLSSELLNFQGENNINNKNISFDKSFKIGSDDICKITYNSIVNGKKSNYQDILPIYAREAI
jgi:tRNA threonylcarbamoyladenosine biosynthesis protein TsaB